ncbi:MAG: ABC transporter permease [Candidatus Marinimicrobia bacterium]|nr:ABC transporter permease [Candidatus Neomarinimicrobiota bacterium]
MKNVLVVMRWEYLTRIRTKWFIISTIIMPLIILASMFIPTLIMTGPDTEVKVIAIVDATQYLGGIVDKTLGERYKLKDDTPKYQVVLLQDGNFDVLKKQASELLDSDVIYSYLVIHEDVMNSNEIKYYARNLGNFKDQEQICRAVNKVISRQRMLKANFDPEVISSLIREVDFKMLEVGKEDEEKEGSEIISYLTPIIFVMMLFFAIFMSSQILLRSVMEERTNRLVEILLSSITPGELMSGKIIGLGLLGLTQLALYLIVGYFASSYKGIQIVTSANVILFLIYFVLGYLLYASIFASIGTIFNSEHEAQQVSSFLSIICVIPIMLSSYVIANPQSTTTTILSFIPVITPFFMILRIGVEIPPLWEIFGTIGVLILFVWLTMLAAGKIFKVAVLIYGKRATLSEIWQWVKE